MREDYEKGLRALAEGMQAANMTDAAEYCRQASYAIGRRDRALSAIKQIWVRWYNGNADAESVLMDVESFAVSPWIQEEIEADKAETAQEELLRQTDRVIRYLREIGQEQRGEKTFPASAYADGIADDLAHTLAKARAALARTGTPEGGRA